MTVDYEVEYNNRARVPEHPDIFARWQREGAAYRAAANNPKLAISYGPSSRRTIDLFPAKDDDKAPLAMFIHGGWWRSLEPASFSQMAAGPNGRGVSVAVWLIFARWCRSPTS
jgi:arylformamidase